MTLSPRWEVNAFSTSQRGRWRPREITKVYLNKHLLSNDNEQEPRQRQDTDLSFSMCPGRNERRILKWYLCCFCSPGPQYIAQSEKIPDRYLFIWLEFINIKTNSAHCFSFHESHILVKSIYLATRGQRMNLKLAFINYLEACVLLCKKKMYVYIDIYVLFNAHKPKKAYYFLYFPASRNQF